jgi:hypothetical protein
MTIPQEFYMSLFSRLALAALALLALTFGRAEASLLQVVYSGVTAAGSINNGSPITAGTAFTATAVFNDVPASTNTGLGNYEVLSLTLDLAGSRYTVPAGLLSTSYGVILADPAASIPGYTAALRYLNFAAGFIPIYTATTPTLNPQQPAPTNFSGFQGDLGLGPNPGLMAFFTAADLSTGVLIQYDQTAGLNTYLSYVPEIDALSGTGALTLVGLALALAGERRRKQA